MGTEHCMPEEEEGIPPHSRLQGVAEISDHPCRGDCRYGACAAMDRGAAGSRRVVMGLGPGAAPLACRASQAPCQATSCWSRSAPRFC